MSKLPAINGKQLIKALSKVGWVIKSTRGSHVKLVKSGAKYPIIIPSHGSAIIPKGTLLNILRDAGISREELIDIL